MEGREGKMKKILRIAVLVLVCVGQLFLGLSYVWSKPVDQAPKSKVIPVMKGCVFTSWLKDDYKQPLTEKSLRQMKADGCEYVSVVVTWYQKTVTSTEISRWDEKTPSDVGVIKVIKYAHSLGIKVFIKPHVDVLSKAYRQDIRFETEADWTAWFESYDKMISHYLDLARVNGADGFIIGTELSNTQHRETDWRSIIDKGRNKFPGWLTYCANHDAYASIKWWDALDFIGISAYFKLTESYAPSVEEIIIAWQPWISDLSAFAAAQKKDIVFLEIGYQSYDGANTNPNWAPTESPDLQEQADCYQAAFEVLFKQPWFKGMYWWMWYWDPSQNVNGFDVYTKPAEKILRKWYAGK
jgi:hypothetical protein